MTEQEDNYICEKCSQEFGSSRALGVHRSREHRDDSPWKSAERLRELYHGEDLTMREVAQVLDCSARTVEKWMGKLGVESDTAARDRPPQFMTTEDGYERWRCQYNGEANYVYTHRLLAVSVFGIGSVKNQIVHHTNNISWDNRPRNLEVMSQSEHARVHSMEGDD